MRSLFGSIHGNSGGEVILLKLIWIIYFLKMDHLIFIMSLKRIVGFFFFTKIPKQFVRLFVVLYRLLLVGTYLHGIELLICDFCHGWWIYLFKIRLMQYLLLMNKKYKISFIHVSFHLTFIFYFVKKWNRPIALGENTLIFKVTH